jgi:hypothetical protein
LIQARYPSLFSSLPADHRLTGNALSEAAGVREIHRGIKNRIT